MWKNGMPQAIKDKISKKKKKQFRAGLITMPDRTGKTSWNKNQHLSEEHKKHISATLKKHVASGTWHNSQPKGSKLSEDHKNKISEGRSGIAPWNKNRTLSPTHRKAISETRRKQEQKRRKVIKEK